MATKKKSRFIKEKIFKKNTIKSLFFYERSIMEVVHHIYTMHASPTQKDFKMHGFEPEDISYLIYNEFIIELPRNAMITNPDAKRFDITPKGTAYFRLKSEKAKSKLASTAASKLLK